MANRNNRAISRANRNIQNIAKGVSANMDTLYRNTYMSNPQQSRDLEDLSDRVNASIDHIINRNMDIVGIPNISKLYTRIADKASGSDANIAKGLSDMFDTGLMTDDLYSAFMSNRMLKELDTEIDTVCRYMPELEEALAVQKDCVLSADHFSKDFLNFESSLTSTQDQNLFGERAKDLKDKYSLAKLVDEIYDDTSKYGEKFIYRVPYATAIGKLLATKPDASLVAPLRNGNGIRESQSDSETSETYLFSLTESGVKVTSRESGAIPFTESAVWQVHDGKDVTSPMKRPFEMNEKFNIAVEINHSGIIESAVREAELAIANKRKMRGKSLCESYIITETKDNRKDIQARGNVSFGNYKTDDRMIANDGLVAGNTPKPVDVKIAGCVIRKLERDQVVPIYIDDMCLGYYYFELRTTDESESFFGFKNILGDPLTNMRGDNHGVNNVDTKRQDDAIRYVAGQLSSFIDKQFVNTNQDLAKEIYMILRHNDLFNTPSIDLIKVTFIPPEDMVHFYFKQDPHTHRGISDLSKGLIPAKIYSSLYITNAIGNLTRGFDKRAYYVKQTVDTNIAQTLLTTINQIKQGNFGIRQFQNINNILNITGRFNDYVIPTNASGDPPISFEVIPGQQIEPPNEIMEACKEAAVSSTGVPYEIIQTRQSIDYAMQLTMSSSKMLRFCYKRQELFQNLLAQLITPIYNYEYDEKIMLKIVLPPPSFINMVNSNQLIDNTKNMVMSIVEIEMANELDEKVKQLYTRELFKHYMGTHLDISQHSKILERAKMLAKTESDESHSDEAGSEYYGGGDNYNDYGNSSDGESEDYTNY